MGAVVSTPSSTSSIAFSTSSVKSSASSVVSTSSVSITSTTLSSSKLSSSSTTSTTAAITSSSTLVTFPTSSLVTSSSASLVVSTTSTKPTSSVATTTSLTTSTSINIPSSSSVPATSLTTSKFSSASSSTDAAIPTSSTLSSSAVKVISSISVATISTASTTSPLPTSSSTASSSSVVSNTPSQANSPSSSTTQSSLSTSSSAPATTSVAATNSSTSSATISSSVLSSTSNVSLSSYLSASSVAVVTSPGLSTSSSTSSIPLSSTSSVLSAGSAVTTPASYSVSSTILVLAPNAAVGYSGTSGFAGYGIPYELVLVPQTGATLPTLSLNTTGNYAGFVLLNELAYDYNGTWKSALTTEQFATIYAYQAQFGARMVRINVYPGPDFGVTTAIAGAGCCNAGVEQYMRLNDTSAFPTAGLVANENVTMAGLWHYPAVITNSTLAKAFATFDPSSDGTFKETTVAAVINTFDDKRQQMVWFTSWASEWASTSAYAQHAYIHWLTRGLFLGRRRIYFSTQIDDVHLATEIYYPTMGNAFRLRTSDLDAHVTWQKNINARLPKGSNYTVELAHNGNGDIEAAFTYQWNHTLSTCTEDGAIEFEAPADTALEFQKPLGSGSNHWPLSPSNYTYSLACAKLDDLANWFTTPANLNSFMHVSHTFSHMSLNNATYSDAYKEIQFNQRWMSSLGISSKALYFSKGLVPPAITGLHNGDVIRAWLELGVNAVVGDNTRSVLMSKESPFWPVISTVESNGYAGLNIVPRWATTIYYNCDTPACTTQEWVTTSGGKGGFEDLLANAKATNTWHLFGLRQDPFMFHQANMRQSDMPTVTIGSQTGPMSLLMMWTELITQEMTRLTTWPLVTLKHDDIAQQFLNRMALDKCAPTLKYQISNNSITGVQVGAANGNTCGTSIPVTFPGTASTTSTSAGIVSEQIGNDPLTVWTQLKGSAVSFDLGTPIALTA